MGAWAINLWINRIRAKLEAADDGKEEAANEGEKATEEDKAAEEPAGKEKETAETKVNIDDADILKYVAVAYTDPNYKYYWGKITKVFSQDSDAKNN